MSWIKMDEYQLFFFLYYSYEISKKSYFTNFRHFWLEN